MTKPKGAIAAGHPETARAAEQILREGGNAFDAVVAAQFAAFVTEPVLTSPGGGGFLLAEKGNGEQVLYDFFVQTPVQKRKPSETSFFPISADFGEVQQEFHIGTGSVAVPGMVKGLYAVHEDLCSLPMKKLAEPAIRLARQGVVVNSFQSGIFDIINSIYSSSEESIRIFQSRKNPGKLIREGEVLKLPELADLLEELIRNGEEFFYGGEIADLISRLCRENGGHLTREDFQNYCVVKRKPLQINYKGNKISINPPPGSGGLLIGFALKLMESLTEKLPVFGSSGYLDFLAQIQKMTNKARVDAFAVHASDQPETTLLDMEYLNRYKKQILNRSSALKGTTQISIVDKEGNMASLTSSNGEGSGVIVQGAGFMLNNMLGEQDLHPGGFHTWKPDQRLTSMMAPGILRKKNGNCVVFGSGGSNRIRTAILQVLVNLIDFDMTLKDAVNAPRIHCEEGKLNAESGFEPDQFSAIEKFYTDIKTWKTKSLFFGGAHSVGFGPDGFSGAGDSRRGGVSIVVQS